MASPFDALRQPIVAKRPPNGSYVDGVYVQGEPVTIPNVRASIQPASSDDLQTLDENRRTQATFRLYTETKLREALEGVHNPDIVTIDSEDYEVVKVFPWKNNILPHYKVLVQRKQPL